MAPDTEPPQPDDTQVVKLAAALGAAVLLLQQAATGPRACLSQNQLQPVLNLAKKAGIET